MSTLKWFSLNTPADVTRTEPKFLTYSGNLNVRGDINLLGDIYKNGVKLTLTGDALVEALTNRDTFPVGSIVNFPWSADIPNGFLKCDGSAVSRETYEELFAVIGESYGAGDGSTTFNLPTFYDSIIKYELLAETFEFKGPWENIVGSGIYYVAPPDNSTTVGIGTTTPNPAYALDVVGDIQLTGDIYKNGELYTTSTGSGGSLLWQDGANRVYVTDGTRVGIGVTIPRSSLHIRDDTVSINFGRGFRMGTDATFTNINHVTRSVGNDYFYIQGVKLDINENPSYTTEIHLNPLGGNVGVGTNNPLYSLDVSGDINLTGELRINGVSLLGGPDGQATWTSSGNNIFYLGGNVGIGTTPSGHRLNVNGDVNLSALNSCLKIESQPVLTRTVLGPTVLESSLTSLGYLNNLNVSGNVGVGTQNPLFKVDIFGDINIRGNIRQNGLIFTGSSSWFEDELNVFTSKLVGIGTTEPRSILDVTISSATFANNVGVKIGDVHYGLLTSIENQTGNYFLIQGTTNDNSMVDVVINSEGGNVGVGITNPSANLHVSGSSRIDSEVGSIWSQINISSQELTFARWLDPEFIVGGLDGNLYSSVSGISFDSNPLPAGFVARDAERYNNGLYVCSENGALGTKIYRSADKIYWESSLETTDSFKSLVTRSTNLYAAGSDIYKAEIPPEPRDTRTWSVTNNNDESYSFTGYSTGENPELIVPIGNVIIFEVNSVGQPLWIKTERVIGEVSAVDGVNNNGSETGTVIWDTRGVEAGTYYYVSENILGMSGIIQLINEGAETRAWDVENNNNESYTFSGYSSGENPDLVVPVGTVMVFDMDAAGQPLWIKTSQTTGTGDAVEINMDGNGTDVGRISWNTSNLNLGTYFYVSENLLEMSGIIQLVNDGAETRTWEVLNNNDESYSFSGYSSGENPDIIVPVGTIVILDVDSVGQPIWIKTVPTTGTGDAISSNIVGNGSESGFVKWNTSGLQAGTYYYISENVEGMRGTIQLVNDGAELRTWDVLNNNDESYSFSGYSSGENPLLLIPIGTVIVFNINAIGEPLTISFDESAISQDIVNNGVDQGKLIWNTSRTSRGIYTYQSGNTPGLNGTIKLYNPSSEIRTWDIANNNDESYTFSGYSSGENPNLIIPIGTVIIFNMNSVAQPLWVKTSFSIGNTDAVEDNIVNNGSDTSQIIWDTTDLAPGLYYYVSENLIGMAGRIKLVAPDEKFWFVTNNNNLSYSFFGTTNGENVDITAFSGEILEFNINSVGQPFYIKSSPVVGTEFAIEEGITGNGTEDGTITWNLGGVDSGTYYYISENEAVMTGLIQVLNENSETKSWNVSNNNDESFSFTGQSAGENPELIVPVGTLVVFNVNSTGQPLWIKTTPTIGTGDAVTQDIFNNGIEQGKLSWNTSNMTTGTYYYVSENNLDMLGIIRLITPLEEIQWSNLNVPGSWNQIISSPSAIVAVGNSGSITYSSDGILWETPVTTITQDLYSIVYNGSFYIVTGSQCCIFKSTDLETWEQVASGLDQDIVRIIWNQETSSFLAVAANGDLIISESGTTWTKISNTGIESATSVAWSPSLKTYIISSLEGDIYYSNMESFIFKTELNRITMNGFVGVKISDPQYTLDVDGDINISDGSSYKIDGTDVLTSDTLGTGVVNSSLTSVGTLTSLTVTGDVIIDTTTLVVNSDDDRVGVNTSDPQYTLDVDGDINISDGSSYKIDGTDVLTSDTLGTGVVNSSLTSVGTLTSLTVTGDVIIDTTTLVVNSDDDRVGVNTSDPQYTLDVDGDINFSGSLYQNGIPFVSGGGGGGGSSLPTGSIISYPSTAPLPDGFLRCDGSEVSRDVYSQLFAVIGTTYGSGDGSTTFNLPNIPDTIIQYRLSEPVIIDYLPIGSVITLSWTIDPYPPGWLKCNGSDVSRTTYSELFNAIGTDYGEGDGTTTFTLPHFFNQGVKYRTTIEGGIASEAYWIPTIEGNLYNTTNVGIGTTDPVTKLHVVGNARIDGNLTVNGIQTIINTEVETTSRLEITNTGTGPAVLVNQTGTQPIANFQDDGVTALLIADGGNVGLGTTNPGERLDVVGNARVSGGLTVDTTTLVVNSSTDSVGIGTTNPGEKLDVVGNARISGGLTVDTNTLVVNSSTDRVGIGTTNPTSTLDVRGTMGVDGNLGVGGLINTIAYYTVSNVILPQYLGTINVADVKSSTTDGGSFDSGSWEIRTLNTIVSDTYTSGSSILSDQTLCIQKPLFDLFNEGRRKRLIIRAKAPAYSVGRHQCRVGVRVGLLGSFQYYIGTSEFSNSSSGFSTTSSMVDVTVDLIQPNDDIYIQVEHRCEVGSLGVGFGQCSGFDTNSIYTTLSVDVYNLDIQ